MILIVLYFKNSAVEALVGGVKGQGGRSFTLCR